MRSKASWPALTGLACALFFPALGWAIARQPLPDPRQDAGDEQPEASSPAVWVIRAAQVVVRPGVVLENTSVMVRDGTIVRIAADIPLPEGAKEIKGRVVCASFIDPWSALGIDGGVLDDSSASPSTRTADGLDLQTNDHLREEALRAGVTAVRLQGGISAPVGGLGAICRLDPEVDVPAESLVVQDADIGMSIGLSVESGQNFRRLPDGSFVREGGVRALDVFDRLSAVDRVIGNIETGSSYREEEVEYRHELEEWQKQIDEAATKLEEDFKKAKKDRDKKVKEAEEKDKEFKEKSYKEDKKPRTPKFDEDKAALARIAEGEIPLVVEVHREAEIRNLLEGTKRFTRLRLILAGGTEALPFAKELAERRIPVIVWPALRGTARADEHSEHSLSLAAKLAEAGVPVLLGSGGRDAALTRDLPLLASMAVGAGLDREKAFEALTLGAARAFDVQDRLGSIEVGKDADLLVLDAMPLEANSRVRYVFCGGRLAITPEN